MTGILIDKTKCDGIDCAECVDVCSMNVLAIENNNIIIKNLEECSLCGDCTDVCSQGCILINA
jgi:NAD-dependent dihydropyrimidine dehydrogenase PreA subunit